MSLSKLSYSQDTTNESILQMNPVSQLNSSSISSPIALKSNQSFSLDLVAQPHRRQLTRDQLQAYEGARMFYLCTLPLSMVFISGIFVSFLVNGSPEINWMLCLIVSMWISFGISNKFYRCASSASTELRLECHTRRQKVDQVLSQEEQWAIKSEVIELQSNEISEIGGNSALPPSMSYQSLFEKQGQVLRYRPSLFFCGRCRFIVPYRSRHCQKCQCCIQRYDHHCFWLGNCVGRHNHRPFYKFLLAQSVNNYLTWTSCCWAVNLLDETAPFSLKVALYCLELLSLGFLAFTGYLALYHTMLILTAQTTWEHMRREKISYLKHLPKGLNPFSLGPIGNLRKFFTQATRIEDPQIETELWDSNIPTYGQAKELKPVFNLIDNQYYSCC